MINDVKKVTVKYNDSIVGYLAEIEPSVIGFQYDDAWVKKGFSISPLSLPLDNISRDEITKIRQKMAIVFQEYSLLSHLSVFDNVALPLRVRGVSEVKIKKLVSKVLDWVGLGKYSDANPKSLSGGQQQRVSVARAIIVQPSILLADEPTGNLDDENASRLMELFIQMNKMFGTTIILATHNKKLMETYKFPVIKVENHCK